MMRACAKAVGTILVFVSANVSAYSVLNPKPDNELRDFSTDRPDTTEGPFTVDAGHVQLEWEIASYGTDRENAERTNTLTSSINIKLGVSDNVDLQLILEPSTHVETRSAAGTETASGMNDTVVRAKFNLWGNDGGDTAFALLPFVSFPTHDSAFGSDGKTEGGLILPLEFKLPGDWDAATMLEFDGVRNRDNDGYVLELVESISLSHTIVGDLGGFFELVNLRRNESGAKSEGYFDSGLMYTVGNNMQIDAGFNFGITAAAEDARYFVGISWRH